MEKEDGKEKFSGEPSVFDILINSHWVWSPICKYYSKALWWIALHRQLIWPLHLTRAIFLHETKIYSLDKFLS